MYTVCYVLADNEELFYYNQLLISLYSLRKRGNNGRVCVLMDIETIRYLEKRNRRELDEFRAERVVIQVPDAYSQKEKSRFMKTSLRDHLEGDVLYIDTDTVITDSFPSSMPNADLALVSDCNENKTDIYCNFSIVEMFEKSGYTLNLQYGYFNSGVIWAKDSKIAHAFFRDWHEEWKHCRKCGVIQDQPSLNYVNCKRGGEIGQLEDIWNVQICCLMSLQYLRNALIIHYFNVPWERMRTIYLLSNPEIQKKGYRSKEVQHIIERPKDALSKATFLRSDSLTDEVMYCKAFTVLKKLYAKHPLAYRGLNYMLSIPSQIRKGLNSKKHERKSIE